MRKFYWCILLSLLEVSVTVVKVWKPVWIVIVNVINCVCIIEYVSILFLYVLFIFVCSFLPTLRGNTVYLELPVALWIFSHGYAVCIAAEQ